MPPPFPFCGLMHVKCDEPHPMIHLPLGDRWSEKRYEVINISSTNTTPHIRVKDRWLGKCLHTNKCNCLDNFALPNSSLISFKLTTPNRTLLKCDRTLHNTALKNFTEMTCRDYNIYFCPSNEASQSFPSGCSSIQLPVNESSHKDELNLTAVFDLELHVSDDCSSCHGKEGKENKYNDKVVIPLAVGCTVFFMITLFVIFWHLYKKKISFFEIASKEYIF
ncbi:hypothetical protein RGQ29_001713 [Quercus rubra]|uniref:Uncharacterized protein n=1 Tax=Quercus rubra TaxID=3512 RepID=A0AAN7GCA3_QUERU|nr:hypothetical protein RGQ29_001713 [Quercus rubra]